MRPFSCDKKNNERVLFFRDVNSGNVLEIDVGIFKGNGIIGLTADNIFC